MQSSELLRTCCLSFLDFGFSLGGYTSVPPRKSIRASPYRPVRPTEHRDRFRGEDYFASVEWDAHAAAC